MEIECFRVEVTDHVAVLTFDRPPVNAQSRRSREELIWLLDGLSDADDVRVVVLTGAGRVFSAGADIKERAVMPTTGGEYLRHNRITREAFYAITDCRKPVIAALNGPAIGAGYALAACADIRICAESAWVQMPEIDVGLAGGAKFLTAHFPPTYARSIFYTGRKVPADELYRLGVVEQVVEDDRLLDAALDLARTIAAKSPVAVQAAKHAFNTVEELPFRDGYRFEQGVTIALAASPETRRAQAAFGRKAPDAAADAADER